MVTSRSKRKTNKAGAKMLTLKLQNVESTNQMGDSDHFYIKSMSRHKMMVTTTTTVIATENFSSLTFQVHLLCFFH